MSSSFRIDSDWLEGGDHDVVERESFAQIVISAEDQVATELEDLFARTIRRGPRASAYCLAQWFAENWWRLRWEPESKSTSWRLSHVVAAAGGGFAWPDLRFVSDGVHVLVEARKTLERNSAPVRYIGDIDIQITAASFEAGIDEFVDRVLARLSSTAASETELAALWKQLQIERRDPVQARLRQLEALLGFDPDEAPEGLIASLEAAIPDAGLEAVDEIAAAAKGKASEALRDILKRTRESDIEICVQSASTIQDAISGLYTFDELPWQRAARVAKLVRDVWGVGTGPIKNKTLSDLLHVPRKLLDFTPSNGLAMGAGLRSDRVADALNIVLRSRVPTGRRFDIMRLVGDYIVAGDRDRLLPATAAKTDRQKFQRAFAQEFLLPFDELSDVFGSATPSDADILDDDIEDVATHYEVSPLMVRTVLVNRGLLPRESLAVVT